MLKTVKSLGLSSFLSRSVAIGALALSAAAATGGGCASAPVTAPVAPAQPLTASDYYPLEAGWKWAYDLERDAGRLLAVYAVLARTPDAAIVEAGDQRISYAVTAQGVAQKEGAIVGDFVLKNPIALGAKWDVFAGTAQITAVGQKVSVPSGDYAGCVVVETLRREPNRLARTTYAPGIGPVVIEVQVESEGRLVTTLRAELRGATKPGADPLAIAP